MKIDERRRCVSTFGRVAKASLVIQIATLIVVAVAVLYPQAWSGGFRWIVLLNLIASVCSSYSALAYAGWLVRADHCQEGQR
jgi:hypothetical protein